MKNKTALLFILCGIFALLFGVLMGILAAMQYLLPSLLKEVLPFNLVRPFHVTSALSWIILCASGSIYFFISNIENQTIYSTKLIQIHFWIFCTTGITIYACYATGNLGGKEYLEFPPILIIPILLGWVLFGYNYFKTLVGKVTNWPVYYWMWGTGIVFMIYHLCESYTWVLPTVKENFIQSLTIQWKAGGSFVGSWNMLVYGISIYLMAKIKGDEAMARSKEAFFFYFLGLTNLMFGWAHHVYIVPTAPWVRYFAYAISMTEWVVLVHLINCWRKSLSETTKLKYFLPYKFLAAAEIWILLNLALALILSIPAINLFTHGTPITVAHSMGTTIGINTTILLASLLYIISIINLDFNFKKWYFPLGFQIFNLSLVLFWICLLLAGIKKSNWMYFTKDIPFSEMQASLYWYYSAFVLFGIGISIGISFLIIPCIKPLFQTILKK
jgi:nitric oxide reductase subunit B